MSCSKRKTIINCWLRVFLSYFMWKITIPLMLQLNHHWSLLKFKQKERKPLSKDYLARDLIKWEPWELIFIIFIILYPKSWCQKENTLSSFSTEQMLTYLTWFRNTQMMSALKILLNSRSMNKESKLKAVLRRKATAQEPSLTLQKLKSNKMLGGTSAAKTCPRTSVRFAEP